MASEDARRSPGTEPGFFYGYVVVVAAFFIMMVVFGLFTSFGVFFKPMLIEFGWTRAMTSGAFSLSMVIYGLLGIVMGGLADRFGARVVITLCGFLLGLGYFLMSQIGAAWQLYLYYGVIIGTGTSAMWVPLMSTVARWFVKRRTVMTGIVLSGAGIGTLITAPVASQLIFAYGWRTSYIILGGIVSIVAVLAAQFLRRDPTQMGQVPYGENEGEEQELKFGPESLTLREAACTKQFWVALAIFFCLGFCVYAVMVHIAPHATELGISATSAANILATVGGAGILGRIVLGGAADRIGNRPALIVGFILMAASLLWLVPAREAWILYLFAGVFGFAFGGCGASESPLVAVLFGLGSHGLILGMTAFAFAIGGAAGPFLAGYIFDVTGGYQVAFSVCAAVAVVALILALIIRKRPRELSGPSSVPF